MSQVSGSDAQGAERNETLQVRGDRVVLGEWSGDLGEMIAKDVELREMLHNARYEEARALVQAEAPEAQAALVSMDENPEEVLSLTGMDRQGRPGYSPAVVDKLPADIVAEVLVPRNSKLVRFNVEVLRQMSPEAFARVVDETLDPIYYHGNRARVSWEWMEAVAALEDDDKIAELLYKVDPDLLEDALLERVGKFDMFASVPAGQGVISAYRALSESGQGVILPTCDDPEVNELIQMLHRAAPELMAGVLRNAWERAGGGR